jgi:hypothetical protein
MEYNFCPVGSMVKPKAAEAPVGKGDPTTALKLPVAELIANAEIVLSNEFDT